MKKNFKSTIVKAAAISMSLAMLTGCGSKENNGGGSGTATAAVTQTENKVTEEVTGTAPPTEEAPTQQVTEAPADNTTPAGTEKVTEAPTQVITKDQYKMLSVEYKTKDLESTVDMTDITKIVFTEEGVTSVGKKEVRITDVNGRKTVTITDKGKYLVSGTCSNGQIIINADKDKDVRLVLNGLNLTCPDSAVIYGRQCDKLIITTISGTENTLSVPNDIVYDDEEKKNPDACIFVKDDLVFNGTGTLNIKAAKSEGIHSTDSIKLVLGNINVESGDRGIRGKKFIAVKEAKINIKSDADALRTTAEDDPEKGYIVIQGGSISIETTSEGIQATGDIQITGGTLDISASGKKSNAMKSDRAVYIENATVTVSSEDSIKANMGVLAAEGTIKVKG